MKKIIIFIGLVMLMFINVNSVSADYIFDELDALEHEITFGYENSLVMIDSTHFMLAYAGDGEDGYIKTFSIDGSYGITQIDVLEHDTIYSVQNSLIKIDSTHFMLAYKGDGYDGYIKTFSIDGSYGITQIDVLEHDISDGAFNSLTMIDSTHFMLAYTGVDSDGYIKTFSTNSSYGDITQIDVLEHDTISASHNSLIMIDSTHFMLAYADISSDGYIKTFSTNSSYGDITQIDVLEHDAIDGRFNSLLMIDSTHFMLAYKGDGNDGYIKTFSVDGSYDITQIDILEHDILNGEYNSLVMINSTHFMLAYTGDGTDGYIKTFSINLSYGDIAEVDSLEHDIIQGTYNSLVMIDSTHFMLAYTGDGYDGYIKTFNIDYEPSNTCTPPAINTDWVINSADNCDLSSQSIDLGTGYIYFTGNGNITFTNSNITTKGFERQSSDGGLDTQIWLYSTILNIK